MLLHGIMATRLDPGRALGCLFVAALAVGCGGGKVGDPGQDNDALSAPDPTAPPPPEMRAPRVDDASITIDGAIEPAWDAATKVTFANGWLPPSRLWSDTPTSSVTAVRALWSATALYMLWELDGAQVQVDDSRPVNVERVGLYNEDCVEVFITPDNTRPLRYFEIEVGPLGHFFDLLNDLSVTPHVNDASWSSHPEIKTTIDGIAANGKAPPPTPHHVVIEAAFRAQDLVAALHQDAKLRINQYRMEGKAPAQQFLAWSPTGTTKPNFHVPARFGTLVLDGR
jgi:hypothetical protein